MKPVFLMLIAMFSFNAFAEEEAVNNAPSPSYALEQLESDATVYGATYAGVKQFAKTYNLEVERALVTPVGSGERYFNLTIILSPKDRGEAGTYPYVIVDAKFVEPSNFEQVVKGQSRLGFYKIDVGHGAAARPRQPGKISSAGG